MSYDLFVQRFTHGQAAHMPVSAFQSTFGQHVQVHDADRHFWHVIAPDQGHADIYAPLDEQSISGLMINHFSNGAVVNLLVQFAHQADATILGGDLPAVITKPGQREHLPAQLRPTAILIHTGPDLEHLLKNA